MLNVQSSRAGSETNRSTGKIIIISIITIIIISIIIIVITKKKWF